MEQLQELIPVRDFEVVKVENDFFIKYIVTGALEPADKYVVALWNERVKLIERIHKLETE